MKVRAHQYDTVDALCWRHYGRTQGVTEQVLKANPGLAEYGPFLPHGLQVELPDIPTTTPVQTVPPWACTMTRDRISATITYCIAVVLAWLGDLSIKDASTLGGLMIGVLMLAINWYYKHKAYQLLRDGLISREDYESINR